MKKLKSDVTVIAAGTAGLAAAVAAAERGARVTVFEKRGKTGGTGNFANMIFAVESRLQKDSPSKLTVDEAFAIHMECTHWRADARLVKAYYDKSADTIDWLEKMGVQFDRVISRPSWAKSTAHCVKRLTETKNFKIGCMADMMRLMTDRTRSLGVKIYTKTPVKKILKKDGRIAGVIGEDTSGEKIHVISKAIIIATGGFSCNPDLIKKYTGFTEGRDLFIIKVPGLTGDGIKMAWEVGAATTEMRPALIFHLPPPYVGPGGAAPQFRPFTQPNLLVNLFGERFVREDIIEDTEFMGNAISLQKNRCAFMIFDGEAKKFYADNPGIMMYNTPGFPGQEEDLDDLVGQARKKGYKHLFMEDSLKAICAKTSIDHAGLQKTVAEYNSYCKNGRDKLFAKKPEYLRPIKNPKFYAARFFPGAYGTIGGIRINYKAEVVTDDLDAIPGLYAAGSDANNIYGDTYVPLGGNYTGFAVNTGRIAGENAVEYIKSVKPAASSRSRRK